MVHTNVNVSDIDSDSYSYSYSDGSSEGNSVEHNNDNNNTLSSKKSDREVSLITSESTVSMCSEEGQFQCKDGKPPPAPPGNTPVMRKSILKSSGSSSENDCVVLSDISVSFSDINIREYGLTMGDHPDCSWGPPLSLDWDYAVVVNGKVDEYEKHRGPMRKPRQMVQSAVRRRSYLHTIGFSKEEVKEAARMAQKNKAQRNRTRAMIQVLHVETAIESVGRKLKRAVSKKHKQKKIEEDAFIRGSIDMKPQVADI